MSFLLFKIKIIAVFVSFFWCFQVSGQVADIYINVSGTYNTFVNTSEFIIDKHRFLPGLHTGIGFYLGSGNSLKLNWETGLELRGFVKEYPFVKSEYNFLSYTNKVLLEYLVYEKVSIEGGIGFDFYQSIYKENGNVEILGNGIRNFDILIIGGLNYEILDWLDIGVRMKYGFVPMIHGQKVLDYGGVSEKKSHINICAGEVFMRFIVFKN